MPVDLFEEEQGIFDAAAARVQAVKDGADFDFEEYRSLVKEYGRLLKQLRRSTRIADRTTFDLYESNLDLTDKIHYDMLTGLYNRRFLEENLKRVIKSLSRSGGCLSVIMMDLDYFKKYNDTYGHTAGDMCLKAVAKALTGSITRADDFAARYGGEEFTFVLPNTGEEGARGIARRALESVRALDIPHEKSKIASCVTISLGIATGLVSKKLSGECYLKRADEALYLSKQNGRNQLTYLSMEELT